MSIEEKYKGQWDRKKLKSEARSNIKRNYWIAVFVCMLMAFMFAEYGDSLGAVGMYNESYKQVQQSRQTGDHEKNILADKTKLEKALEKAGLELKGDSDLKIIAKRGSLNYLVRGIQEKRGIESSFTDMIKKISSGASGGMIAIAMLAVLLNMVFVLVIKSNFLIGERRFFLENKNHPKTRFGRLFFLFNERNYINPAIVMFMKNLFFALWSLTIAGMFIKQYSYRLVPFIMAENPDIKWKDAITLSRKMMNGNKWRTFVFDLSFWYWYLLKFITAGLVGVFFFNPYFTAAETELYAAIRAESYERGIENIELLNDESLYVRTDNEEYPLHLVSKHADVDEKKWDRSYSFVNLVLIFFTFAFIGWLWEVGLHLVQDHVFVNRGTMFGPWLPIYGVGGTMVLVVLKRFREKPILTFLLTFILCGIVEYVTSWFLEYTKGTKWWDYSGYLLNINGRVCLEGLLIFAIAGSACIYIIGPLFDDLYNKLPVRTRWCFAAVLLALFGADFVYSHFNPNTGEGITDYGYKEDGQCLLRADSSSGHIQRLN